MIYTEKPSSSPLIDKAEEFLKEKLDYDAPRDKWKWARVKDFLRHFGRACGRRELAIYGRAASRLNGGEREAVAGVNYTLLPPLKASTLADNPGSEPGMIRTSKGAAFLHTSGA